MSKPKTKKKTAPKKPEAQVQVQINVIEAPTWENLEKAVLDAPESRWFNRGFVRQLYRHATLFKISEENQRSLARILREERDRANDEWRILKDHGIGDDWKLNRARGILRDLLKELD